MEEIDIKMPCIIAIEVIELRDRVCIWVDLILFGAVSNFRKKVAEFLGCVPKWTRFMSC